jgi:hypothetical protein
MTEDLQRILLVEDNPKFIEAATNYFDGANVSFDLAMDYHDAESLIEDVKYPGAIIDCFFPRDYSDDRTLGQLAIEKMVAMDPQEQFILGYVAEFAKHVDLDDELMKAVRRAGWHEYKSQRDFDPSRYVLLRSLARLNNISGREKTTSTFRKYMVTDASIHREAYSHFKDGYNLLRSEMEKDPANQPLGIFIAGECQERNIPFVLATSTHSHQSLTAPIYRYCGSFGWKIVGCSPNSPDEKATPEFWQRTYETLIREMGGRR